MQGEERKRRHGTPEGRGSRRRRGARIGALSCLVFGWVPVSAAAQTWRVSLDDAENQALQESFRPSISNDGRRVVFDIRDFGSPMTPSWDNVWMRNLQTQQTILLTGAAGNSHSRSGKISGDGHTVSFDTKASIDPSDAGGSSTDVYVTWPDSVGQFELVSKNDLGQGGNLASGYSDISDDGTQVVFESQATNLDGGNHGMIPYPDVFVRDRVAQRTTLVSVSTNGEDPGNFLSVNPAISGNGRFVVFESEAEDLIEGDGGWRDIFLYDRDPDENAVFDDTPGTLRRVSETLAGVGGDRHSFGSDISYDGRFIVFSSRAGNLAPNASGSKYQVHRLDRDPDGDGIFDDAWEFRVVSTDSFGQEGSGDSFDPSLSSDGTRVAFQSTATGLVPNYPGFRSVYVHDVVNGQTTLVSVDRDRNFANHDSGLNCCAPGGLAISGNGRWVAFHSFADNLVPGDTNGYADIFVRVYERLPAVDLGFGLAGTGGLVPELFLAKGNGRFEIELRRALPDAMVMLQSSGNAGFLPFMGGTLVPGRGPQLGPFQTDPLGNLDLDVGPPELVTPMAEVSLVPEYWQFCVLDVGAPQGVALSNAMLLRRSRARR